MKALLAELQKIKTARAASLERRVDPSAREHVVGVVHCLLLELITLTIFPMTLGLAVIVFPGPIQGAWFLKPPQRAKGYPLQAMS